MKREVKGNVTMTLGEYNDLFATILKYENALKITKGYSDNELQCDIDMEAFRNLIEEKKAEFKDNKKFIMRNEFYRQNFTIAELKDLEGDN